MLAIEVELLTGRYVATAYNSRQESEWPPHPARLFSALAATHFAAEDPEPQERAVLEWLETQGPPSIRASGATVREVTTVFVPVNDAAMTDVDEEGAAVDDARAAHEMARSSDDARAVKKAATAVEKAEKRLRSAIDRSTAIPKSGNPMQGLHVLPEHRVRQPRTFPSLTPNEPRVVYIWPDSEPSRAQRETLDQLLSRVVRLGHSASFASARVIDAAVEPVWRPSVHGETILRTVQGGQLAALERAHALHRETEPRLMPARFDGYTRSVPEELARMCESNFADEWLVLRRVGGPSLPMVATAGIARAVRAALMSRLRQAGKSIPEDLSGHGADGGPLDRDHLAIVPIAFVGHENATGSILGVALILPRAASEDQRRGIYTAVDAWEQAVRQEDEDTPRLELKLRGLDDPLVLERVEWGAVQASLRPSTWSRPARRWLSVTPVALDRNPGDLRTRDQDKLATAVGEAETTIRAACVRIGLPEPRQVVILPAAPVAGAPKARAFPSFPDAPEKTRRVLTHALLEFAEPVRGPILIGAGRYVGLGLFRPEDHRHE